LLGFSGVLAAAAALGACGQAANPAGSGSTCSLTTDCQQGYACLTQPDGTRQCSSDFSTIQTTEESGAKEAAPKEGAAAADSTTPTDGTTPTPETGGTPETGTTPETGGPQETGTKPEASTPETGGTPETGSPTDAGAG
jgi:hypothetical protein